MILLADPYSYPVVAALSHWAERWPQVSVLGGLSSGAPMPGGNRIVVDGGVHRSGAAALIVGGSATVTHLVSQGCRPIGQPYLITEAEGNVVRSLGGMPPFERLQQMFSKLDPADQRLVQRGLHVGRVTDEAKVEFERGDFLIRGVLGADRESGAIAIGDEAPIGATVQFHVRDANTADEDLHEALGNSAPAARAAAGALLFTCQRARHPSVRGPPPRRRGPRRASLRPSRRHVLRRPRSARSERARTCTASQPQWHCSPMAMRHDEPSLMNPAS